MIAGLLFLHILLFTFAFALTAGLGILTDGIARRGDAKMIHTAFSASRPLSMTGGYLWLATGVVGGALATAMGYQMSATWLVGADALFIVLMAVGFGMHAPWQARVIAAAATGGPELKTVLNAPAHKIANAVSAVCVLGLLYLMVARPS